MTSNGARRIQLNFGNLPLVEVALRVSFESPIGLKFSIINQVKEHLGDSFPVLAEASRIETAPGLASSVTFGVGQIPGAVYSGNRSGVIIALQGQVVVARWIKRIEKGAAAYPRYSVLRAALWKAYEAVGGACGGSALPLAAVNMSYVNLLDIAHDKPVLTRYFSEIAHVKATEDARQINKIEAAWQDDDAMDLRYSLDRVTATVGDETVKGFRLTTVAGIQLTPEMDGQDALDAVHDKLQGFFRNLISEHARHEWQLVEGDAP